MKTILFPITNRVHEARQKTLLRELALHHKVKVVRLSTPSNDMGAVSATYALNFQKFIKAEKPDLVLIRGDRYEQLPLAMVAAYSGIPIAHIEGFDLSGVIDNKVRYAISNLSDYHFVTNEDSYNRARSMGFEHVWDYGSLDCEYALDASKSARKDEKPYIVALYHPIGTESPVPVLSALEHFDYKIYGIRSNGDYGKTLYTEEYKPDEFVRLLDGATCLVGNSSAGLKESSILGVPVVNIGERQMNRTRPSNVIDVPCEEEAIVAGIQWQMKHGTYERDMTYYKPNASKNIALKIGELI